MSRGETIEVKTTQLVQDNKRKLLLLTELTPITAHCLVKRYKDLHAMCRLASLLTMVPKEFDARH